MSEQTIPDVQRVIRNTLWRIYGYDDEFSDAHPVTRRTFEGDADSVLEDIERAGYVLVKHVTQSTDEQSKSKRARERRQRVADMRNAGMTFRAIGETMGISTSRANELFQMWLEQAMEGGR